MTYNFGDGFDCYNKNADLPGGYWDASSSPGGPDFSVGSWPGRFAGGQALILYGGSYLNKQNNGANDGLHHIVIAVQPTGTSAATTPNVYVALYDGATIQCSIVFRNNGDIVLTSGGPTGAVLATFPAQTNVQNVWTAFEFEVQIHNTLGSFSVRKNGNSVNDFSATSLNTRVSANNYANGIQLGLHSSAAYTTSIDDIFWRSHVSGVAWMGDLRCFNRTPKSDVQAQFTPSGVKKPTVTGPFGMIPFANWSLYSYFISPCDGLLTAAVLNLQVAYTGHVKCAIYSDNISNPGTPGTVLAISPTVFTNPPGSANSFAITPSMTVVKDQKIWMGVCFDTDATGSIMVSTTANGWYTSAVTYASFPASNPTGLSAQGLNGTLIIAPANSGCVNELPNDALTTYVYDGNIGDNDFYSLSPIVTLPTNVVATVARALMRKSDAGTRTASLQLKSGGTTVVTPTLAISNANWLWAYRVDTVNPDTGLQWAASEVDAIQIGPKVVT